MAISLKLSTAGQFKPIIRMPCRSLTITLRIKEALNATKTVIASKPSADTICSGLSKLAELYKRMEDLLNSSTTQVLISHDLNKKWVEELIGESLNFLDVCGSTMDMVTQFKEHIRGLQCALQRRKCEIKKYYFFRNKMKKDAKLLSNGIKIYNCFRKKMKKDVKLLINGIKKYNCFRKKMKKDTKLLIAGLKQVDDSGSLAVVVSSDNHQLAAVMQAVTEVSDTTVCFFESLLLYFSRSISKPNRWSSVVSKLMHKGNVACEGQQQQGIMNKFESIDDDLQALCKNGSSTQRENMQNAKCRMEIQETHLDCMETRLQCIFRCLIGTIAFLLNIMSQ